nr:hypothetical protein DA06_02550 [Georgenia sp. SUBG003]
MPIAEVPEDPATWATSPYSPLPAAEISAAGNTREITFDGADGGLHDAQDQDTGFTMVQPSSANNDYYLPELLDVADGKLTITTTKGIAYSNTGATGLINQQDNTLGVGVDAAASNLEFTTTLNSPTAATSSAQAGLWFGPDDQNYVKLALIGSSSTGRQIQLSREINGLTANGSAAAPSADQVMVDLSQTTIGSQPVTLTMTVNTVNDVITGRYQIGDNPEQALGSLALPANYTDGSRLVRPIEDVTSFGGIFATKRNMLDSAPLSYTFEDFAVAELDAEPPAAPQGLTASPTPGDVQLSWTPADVSSDVVGYRVYRSASSPVPTSGNGIGGATLLTTPDLTDRGVFIGQSYHYAVVAEDAAGNRSVAAETQATVPAVEGETVAQINFQTAAATTPDGYTADTGAAYSDGAGSGWRSDATGAPLDLSTLTRLRTGTGVTSDQRLATIIHMQHSSMSVDGEWEYDLPNGSYTVVAAVGDTGSAGGGGYDSVHAVNAEGVAVVSPFNPSSAREYDEGVATVEVTDGSLTIDAVGGSNTKLAYVGIYAEADAPVAPAAPTGLTGTAAPAACSSTGPPSTRHRLRRLPRHRGVRAHRRCPAQRRAAHRGDLPRHHRRARPDLSLRGRRHQRRRRLTGLRGRRGRRPRGADRPRRAGRPDRRGHLDRRPAGLVRRRGRRVLRRLPLDRGVRAHRRHPAQRRTAGERELPRHHRRGGADLLLRRRRRQRGGRLGGLDGRRGRRARAAGRPGRPHGSRR